MRSVSVFHGSNTPFTQFEFRFCRRDQPINGLGHFCIDDQAIAQRFGACVVQVELESTPINTYEMGVRALLDWHRRGFDACVRLRRCLRIEGVQLIHILEDQPGASQWIITDPRAVKQYTWL